MQSGARHNFVLDRGYLERHAVKNASKKDELLTDPLEMSVWQLKECIWKDWRDGLSLPFSRTDATELTAGWAAAKQIGTSARPARCLSS